MESGDRAPEGALVGLTSFAIIQHDEKREAFRA
jgi:hypothetical protein